MNTPTNPYDQIPYESYAYAASHPSRLATMGYLFGLCPASPERCRVLEIGCASGGNLLPMATAFPDSRFVGIDYSAVQITQAKQALAELGLSNVEFLCVDIRHAQASDLGHFDYVIAHGIYSWLPADVQAAMLALYRDCLAPEGIGYVSYNTLPGWRMRGMIRDMMLFHAELFGDPQTQVAQAKALLGFMANHVPTQDNPYGQYLRSELALISQVNDSYLKHDHLEVHNEALYFRDFMARAANYGLEYLGEAEFSIMLGTGISAEAKAQLNAEIKDIIRLEQYLDFLSNRSFRMTLLVKPGNAIKRNVTAQALASLQIAGRLSPVGDAQETCSTPVLFQHTNGQGVQTSNCVTKAALAVLAEHFPASLTFTDLLTKARNRLPASHRETTHEKLDRIALGSDLLIAYMVPGLLRFDGCDFKIAYVPTDKPMASAYARWQAKQGAVLTSLIHETVKVTEAQRLLLPLLDGSRNQVALRKAFFEFVTTGALQLQLDGKALSLTEDSPLIDTALESELKALAQYAFLQK